MSGAILIRAMAFVAGLAIVAVAVIAWRPAPAPAAVGLELNVSARPTGELAVSVDDSLYGSELFAGGVRARGEVSVRNQTGNRLGVRVRAKRGDRWASQAVRVQLDAAGVTLYRGTLGRLRSHASRVTLLGSGKARALQMEVWLPESTPPGWRGGIEGVELRMLSRNSGFEGGP